MRWRVGLALTMFTVTTMAPIVHAEAPATDTVRRPTARLGPDYRHHPDFLALLAQMRAHPELPPLDFWDAIALCETGMQANGIPGEWDRGHDWGPRARSWVSGGLGLAHTTWRGYGGRQFAPKAAFASKWAQIIVANRVGFIGWQTTDEFLTFEDRQQNRPHFRPAAGFRSGWGGACYRQWVREKGKP